jgi:hypothetical protein
MVRIFLGKSEDGRRIYSARTVRGTRGDADAERARMLRDLDGGTFEKKRAAQEQKAPQAHLGGPLGTLGGPGEAQEDPLPGWKARREALWEENWRRIGDVDEEDLRLRENPREAHPL